ncbi:MAG: glutathione S-transferase family protein [Halobacteriales archaeon]|nr:glutathione S-transferase family protein [Halobacteriales archaeon]
MNMLVDGQWTEDASESTNEEGEFDRSETDFRDWIGPDAAFSAEPGRYHLYIARACPWAHGAALVRQLTGLDEAITMDIVDPIRIDDGWEFSPEKPGCTTDSINGFGYLRDVYTAADGNYTGKVTVPVLWDKQTETIVNNESIEIMRMLDTAFDDIKNRDVDLYPEGYREEIDRIIDDIYGSINNGVYKAGFAKTQDAHEAAVEELFDTLDRYEELLDERRYLAGDVLTLADLRLFPTLVRFDPVYNVHFKCNVRRLTEYHNLWNYTKELYQLPGVAGTVNMDHIKTHYYKSHTDLNPRQLVPIGPAIDFSEPHDRDRLSGGPPAALQ